MKPENVVKRTLEGVFPFWGKTHFCSITVNFSQQNVRHETSFSCEEGHEFEYQSPVNETDRKILIKIILR